MHTKRTTTFSFVSYRVHSWFNRLFPVQGIAHGHSVFAAKLCTRGRQLSSIAIIGLGAEQGGGKPNDKQGGAAKIYAGWRVFLQLGSWSEPDQR